MPRAKREVDWRARKDLPENPYSDSELERIVRTIAEGANHQLSPADRNRLQNEVKRAARAFILAKHQRKGPTRGQIKVALEELHKAADKLLGVVSTLDDATLFALLRQHGEFHKAYSKAQAQDQSSAQAKASAIRIVSALSAEAQAAIKEVGKPHPPADENPLDWIIDWEIDPIYPDEKLVTKFIVWMAFIFNEVTGAEPLCKHGREKENYYGSFLPFVEACLVPLEAEPRKALGKIVQDALPKWREARDARA